MQSPFDVSDLGLRLKVAGLPELENIASIAAQQVFSWLSDSLALEAQSNPLFAIGVPVINALKPLVMAEIAKIAPAPVPPAA